MSILFLSAASFETEPTARALAEHNIDYEIELFGIGCHAAAENSVRLVDTCRNRHIIFVGTAGTFVRFTKPYLVRSSLVRWLPLCERLKYSYAVAGSAADLSLKNQDDRFNELPERKVVCAPNVSLDSTLPADWQKQEYVENLELYSVARIIGPVATTFSVVLGVTNGIGSLAHEQWKKNAAETAQLSANFLLNHLKT